MMNIHGRFNWNPSNKCSDVASRGISVNGQRTAGRPDGRPENILPMSWILWLQRQNEWINTFRPTAEFLTSTRQMAAPTAACNTILYVQYRCRVQQRNWSLPRMEFWGITSIFSKIQRWNRYMFVAFWEEMTTTKATKPHYSLHRTCRPHRKEEGDQVIPGKALK